MGTVPPNMTFKEREVPNTFSATKGPMGGTNEGVEQTLGTGFTQCIHPSYTQELKSESQQSI